MRNLDELRWEQFHIGDIFSVDAHPLGTKTITKMVMSLL